MLLQSFGGGGEDGGEDAALVMVTNASNIATSLPKGWTRVPRKRVPRAACRVNVSACRVSACVVLTARSSSSWRQPLSPARSSRSSTTAAARRGVFTWSCAWWRVPGGGSAVGSSPQPLLDGSAQSRG